MNQDIITKYNLNDAFLLIPAIFLIYFSIKTLKARKSGDKEEARKNMMWVLLGLLWFIARFFLIPNLI